MERNLGGANSCVAKKGVLFWDYANEDWKKLINRESRKGGGNFLTAFRGRENKTEEEKVKKKIKKRVGYGSTQYSCPDRKDREIFLKRTGRRVRTQK